MRISRRRLHKVPALNTAALPDLIFTVLFFFMIVTHMRKDVVKVQYQVPTGTELSRLTKKSAVSYIYIGSYHGETRIQLNDKFASVDEVQDYIRTERSQMLPEDQQQMTVSIKADKDVPMGVITDVKQSLREVRAIRINYSASQKENN